eukprot:s410_g12.t1
MQEKDGNFLFMGVTVCQRAFQVLTGVPAGTIQQAREAVRSNAVTALTRKELGMWATIRNAAQAPRYLDARCWLEVHAERYAEANPMTGQMVLPFGRKSDYYHMYCWERSHEVLSHLDDKWAAQNTFLQAWRCEPQTLLGPPSILASYVCKFLQGLIASTPRQFSEVLDALKLRLGRHYAFQASQRLADERLMEQARRRSTPLMKTGFVLVMGLVGTIWSGTPQDDVLLTTLYEDCRHGGNMQASLLFTAFHKKVVETGVVPEALTISADNTPKETKNAMVYSWMVWMLCCLQTTRLWRIRTVYKLVGHTHSHCDRLFSRVKASLMGKSYASEEDMMDIIISTLKSYKLGYNHLHASLDFEALKTLLGLEIRSLRNVHDLEVYRTGGGIFVRWKQYLSDELWSRPRLVVTPENMPIVARARPPHIKHSFSADMKSKFLDFFSKVEMQLASMNYYDDKLQAGLNWLRNVTQHDTDSTLPVDAMLADIERGGSAVGTIRADGLVTVPDDMILLN